jgi:integrase
VSSIRKKVLKGGVSWEARVNIAGHHPLSKSFEKKAQAKAWADTQEKSIRDGGTVSMKAEKVLVKEALQAYLAAHSKVVEGSAEPVSTLTDTKRYAVESVSHHLGHFSIAKLTHKKINQFIEVLQATPIPPPANKKTKTSHKLYNGDQVRTYSPGSARKLFYALKTSIEWHAAEHGYSGQIAETFKNVNVPPAWSAPRDRRLEGDEEQRLMDACHGMYKYPRGWQLLIGMALETAMRAGELLGMLWSEVNTDPSHRFIVIPKEREKTRRGRQVPLSARALEIIKELRQRQHKDDERVFATFPNSSVILGRGFKRITTRAGCVNLRFHDLRHEATSRFFETTHMQTMEIAAITGHTQLDTLQRYANLRPNVLANKLDAKLNWSDNQQKAQTVAAARGNATTTLDNTQVKLVLESLKLAGLLVDVIPDGSGFTLKLPGSQEKAPSAPVKARGTTKSKTSTTMAPRQSKQTSAKTASRAAR